jgi:hypothetical protein
MLAGTFGSGNSVPLMQIKGHSSARSPLAWRAWLWFLGEGPGGCCGFQKLASPD